MSTKDRCRCLSMKYAALEDDQAVIATPERVLNGHPVGPRTGTAVCISCGVPLYETDIVFAYAYRRAESVQWVVARLFCHSCVSATIRTPTFGTTEVLVGGRLGTIALATPRSHRLCLTELAVCDLSPANEGCSP